MDNWPVLQVNSVQICPNSVWPRSFTTLPSGYAEPEVLPGSIYGSVAPGGAADGGQAILVGGGYINWSLGRNGWLILVEYVNGWPHCSLTTAATAGDDSIEVNDCTGWAISNYSGTVTGATGVVKDSGWQEAIHCTASTVTAGPGTLTLASELAYDHAAGTIVTTLPDSIEQACIFFAASEALTRGATSTTIHSVGGAAQSSSGGAQQLAEEAELLCHPFKRTI